MHAAIIGRWRCNGLSRAARTPIDKDGLCDEERLADSTAAGQEGINRAQFTVGRGAGALPRWRLDDRSKSGGGIMQSTCALP
jgi:hypothetical protein